MKKREYVICEGCDAPITQVLNEFVIVETPLVRILGTARIPTAEPGAYHTDCLARAINHSCRIGTQYWAGGQFPNG